MNISRVSVGIHPPGSVVILPVLISFEEVGLAVSLPDKYRVYVGNISFERPVSVVVDLPGSQKFSVVVIFPEHRSFEEHDVILTVEIGSINWSLYFLPHLLNKPRTITAKSFGDHPEFIPH